MATLPKQSLVDRIDAVQIESYPRPHLGASIIGSPCKRSLVYQFYWAHKNKVDAKLNRIFRLGDDVEERIIEALSTVGIDVIGSQDRVSDETGHAGGSIDGIAKYVPGFEEEDLLFEAKSMNHNNFLEMKRKGVQESKPVHYAQMQMYMGRLNLQFALYVAMDKNTSDLYTEYVPFDEPLFESLKDLEQSIFKVSHINEFPPISTNPSWYLCKFCNAKDACFQGLIERNCRTCHHSKMHMGGKWHCDMKDRELSLKDQQEGCDLYRKASMWE